MRIRHKHCLDEVFFFGSRCNASFASASLRLIIVYWLGFRIAFVRECHHPVFRGNQILVFKILVALKDFGAAFVPILITNRDQFVPDDTHQSIGLAQDLEILPNSI